MMQYQTINMDGSQSEFPTKQNWSATPKISDNKYNPNLPESLTKSKPDLPKLLLTRQYKNMQPNETYPEQKRQGKEQRPLLDTAERIIKTKRLE